ncbi:MAG: sulfatase-like hydrolase/transferase [Alphaproteobacteria bacterium]|nr:sulfatase-like hydrolase/transferase [Alphaproteobacteria bacterium]
MSSALSALPGPGRRDPVLAAVSLAVGLLALGWAPDALRELGVGGADLFGVAAAGVGLALSWWRPAWTLLPGVLGALAVPLCAPDAAPSTARGGGQGPDVLLITVDTVRADAGLVDALPGEWRRWTHAIAPAPWTLPSMISLMQGQDVREHGGGLPVDGGYSAPRSAGTTLAEAFAAAGYRTRAVVCNPHLRATDGFARGFGQFLHHDDARLPQRLDLWSGLWRTRLTGAVSRAAATRDAAIVDQALAWLDEARSDPDAGPQLVWVHLLLPHEYGRDVPRPPPGWRPGVRDSGVLQDAYAANVAVTAGRLRALVEAVGEGTVVAVTSDHGEALGEDGRRGHGQHLDDLELRVPLAIRGPGMPTGAVHHPVAVRDLAATLGALAGVEGLPGADLRLVGPTAVEVGGLRRDATAFARRTVEGAFTERPPVAPGEARPLVPDQREALEALGYVEEEH